MYLTTKIFLKIFLLNFIKKITQKGISFHFTFQSNKKINYISQTRL